MWFGGGGKRVYFGFLARASFGKMPCWDDILLKRGSGWLDHLMHVIEVGSERLKSLSIPIRREKAYRKNKQKGNLS